MPNETAATTDIRRLIEENLKTLAYDKLILAEAENLIASYQEVYLAQLGPAAKDTIAQAMSKLMEAFVRGLNTCADRLARRYAELVSPEEVVLLHDFYASPGWRLHHDKAATAHGEYMQIVLEWMREVNKATSDEVTQILNPDGKLVIPVIGDAPIGG